MSSDGAEPSSAGDGPETRRLEGVSSYFGAVSIRPDEQSLSTRLPVRDDLRDDGGALRIGAITYTADVATGIACGLAVLDRDLWVVTTDLDVHATAPVTVGPLRVDVEVLRAGATTAVARFSLFDEGDGDHAVGGGTATTRPFPFTFDRSFLQFPVGEELHVAPPVPSDGRRLAQRLGFEAVGEDGTHQVAAAEWLRNPWGILHGGVTACLGDVTAEAAASVALGGPVRCTSSMVRYLAPAKVGPVVATPRTLAVAGEGALVEVRSVDQGADDRVVAVATVAAVRR